MGGFGRQMDARGFNWTPTFGHARHPRDVLTAYYRITCSVVLEWYSSTCLLVQERHGRIPGSTRNSAHTVVLFTKRKFPPKEALYPNMFISRKLLALASALLFMTSCVRGATESNAPTLAPLATHTSAVIHCVGITQVPMTADAEQGLPLHVVGNLSCGDVVSILRDDEGYTVRVSTVGGQEGYVARLYLTKSGPDAPTTNPQPWSAVPVNGVVHWRAGDPGCDQFVTNGHLVESVTTHGVTVQIALEDTGWKLRALIAIANSHAEPIKVSPDLVTVVEAAPGVKRLLPSDPVKLSRVVNHQLLLSVASGQPPRNTASLSIASTAAITAAAYQPATPDYFSESIFPVSTSNRTAIVPTAVEIQSLALKHASLKPGENTAGIIWFERPAHPKELSLRVPIGNLLLDFPLSFEQTR